MRHFLLTIALVCACTLVLQAQTATRAPDCVGTVLIVTSAASTPATSTPFDNRGLGCTSWTLFYRASGFTAVNVQLASSSSVNLAAVMRNTPLVFPAPPGTLPLKALDQATITLHGYFPWVAAQVPYVAGSGTVTVNFYGWRSDPIENATVNANIQSPVLTAPVSGLPLPPCNPVRVTGCQK